MVLNIAASPGMNVVELTERVREEIERLRDEREHRLRRLPVESFPPDSTVR